MPATGGKNARRRPIAESDPVFLRAFFALEAQENISVPEAPAAIAGRFDPEFADRLERPQALPANGCRLAAVLRFPVDLRLSVRLQDCKQHRVPFFVIDDRLRRRAACLRARAERFKLLDLTKIEYLCARPRLKIRTEKCQDCHGAYQNLPFHDRHLAVSMIRPKTKFQRGHL